MIPFSYSDNRNSLVNHEPPNTGKPPAWSHPAVVLATCFWIGRIRPAPGTWGSAAAIPIIMALTYAKVPFFVELSLWLTVCCIGIPLCTIASSQLGGQKDPSSIVIDEFSAMPLVLLAVHPEQRTWLVVLIAFLLFRLFDITKPPPCRQLENLPHGLGVMADDWAAAGFSACVLFVILFFLS